MLASSLEIDRDLRALDRCPACSGDLGAPFYEGPLGDAYSHCRRCGAAVLSDGAASDGERAYQQRPGNLAIHTDSGIARSREVHWRHWTRLATPVRGPRKLLDVGCGGGAYLAWAARQGWEGIGCDVSGEAVAAARRRGMVAEEGTVATLDAAHGPFALVTAWDVLEHVDDPIATLHAIRERLVPGGRILIEVPDEAFVGRAVARFGGRLGWAWPDARPFFYHADHSLVPTRRSLEALLERAGLVPVRWGTASSDPELIRRKVEIFHRHWPPGVLAVATRMLRWTAVLGVGNKLLLVARRPA